MRDPRASARECGRRRDPGEAAGLQHERRRRHDLRRRARHGAEARDIRRFTDPKYYFHFDNADFNAQFEAADEAPADDLVPLMRKAARTLADDAAAVWLFSLPNLVITKSNVTGVPQNAATLSFDLTTISVR